MELLLRVLLAPVAIVGFLCLILCASALYHRVRKSLGIGAAERHVAVLVLGDVGRSPRMQYHCLSLADDLPARVSLVGYDGERCVPALQDHPKIRQFLISAPAWSRRLPRAIAMPSKVLAQVVQLLWTLLWSIAEPDVLLLQNPPCIPTLVVALFVRWLRGCRVVVDWHNFGYTVLALSFASGERHPVVQFAKVYERVLGRLCDGGLCVTKAMQRWLREHWGVEAVVLYDRAPSFFRKLSKEESEELFSRLAGEYAAFGRMVPGQGASSGRSPLLVVSSTSWTADEDFGLLLKSIEQLDALDGPALLFVITGKGPLREHYEAAIAKMALKRTEVITAWLSAADYPKLLGSATLGVSLHTSSSGLDLPMKVVDMFGAGLPVCAVGFDCLDELVAHGKNGMIFTSAAELTDQMHELLDTGSGARLEALREGVRDFQALRWKDNWRSNAAPLFS